MRPSVRLSVGQLVTLLDFHCFGVSGTPRSPNFFQFKSYLACSMSSAHLLSCALCKFISTRRPIHPCHTSTYSTMLLHTSLMCYFWRKKIHILEFGLATLVYSFEVFGVSGAICHGISSHQVGPILKSSNFPQIPPAGQTIWPRKGKYSDKSLKSLINLMY